MADEDFRTAFRGLTNETGEATEGDSAMNCGAAETAWRRV
jgi:hypothetical protein